MWLSMDNEDYRNLLSGTLSEKLGKKVAIKSEDHFRHSDIEVDGMVKMVSSLKFEEVEANEAAGQLFDHIGGVSPNPRKFCLPS
ncbi:hypothetical protein HAQ01_11490 [Acidithiobacillus thiooxidans]|uniref:hypothetical protein n=1 Tax=Acidithiobacillus thiooxidans TaxID=930 RepID=UPI001C07C778|nr:hypothetical protein [Acidithiobacillus thiooxidans]MBU2793998.1 hypothetical protein [Acidithiobacillus thiooxidans]